MRVPRLEGIIERRILLNYRVAPEFASPLLPKPFRPKLQNGYAMAGLCLIRLGAVRPKGFPAAVGLRSENAAHRVAVEWTEDGVMKDGVFILRRETSSRFNALVGGRLFPGFHHRAKFAVNENAGRYDVAFSSDDGTHAHLQATLSESWNEESVFGSLTEASEFFKRGNNGFSPGTNQLDGMCLTTRNWQVRSLNVHSVRSTFYDDTTLFPKGNIELDDALLMTNLEHEWQSIEAPHN